MRLELAPLDLFLCELPGSCGDFVTNCVVFRQRLLEINVLFSLCLRILLGSHLVPKMKSEAHHLFDGL